MPQQTDPAVPTRLSSVHNSADILLGRKLRVAGRMLSYDPESGLMLLLDGDTALLTDISACIDPFGADESRWVRERKSIVMVVGYLERSSEQLPIPMLPAYTVAPLIDPYMMLSALVVTPAVDLDMGLWNKAIEERSQHEGRGRA